MSYNANLKLSNKLSKIKPKLSPERQEVLRRLWELRWFRNTEFSLQSEILNLPPEWNGYLIELSKRPDEMENIDVLRLVSFKRGEVVALTTFEVRVQQTNEIIPYWEFLTSSLGNNPGFRGIILLEIDGKVEYFLIKRSFKFPIGDKVYETLGGTVQYKYGELANLPKRVEEEIKRQLGLNKLNIKRFIDLGQMYTDVGRASHHISLFAATIDVTQTSEKLKNIQNGKKLSTKRISFELIIEPISRIHEYIHKVDDSFFHACITRLVSLGILKIK